MRPTANETSPINPQSATNPQSTINPQSAILNPQYEGLVFVRGAFVPPADATVSVFDHGLLYGDGVFEGIRAYNGRVFKLERHIDRLFDSAKAIRLQIPHSHAEVCAIVVESCRCNGITDGYIRLVVTRGAGDLGLDPRTCSRAELIVIVKASLSLYRSPASGIRVVTST